MSVCVLIICHDDIGSALMHATTRIFDELPLPTTVVNVKSSTDPASLIKKLQDLTNKIECKNGILILTDLFGSTPSNIAHELNKRAQTRLVCGLNLPMLIKVMNHPDLPLDQLTKVAVKGGRDGIIDVKEEV